MQKRKQKEWVYADITYNIGEKCRIKTDTKLFDKMKHQYSAEICTIINDELELDYVKKLIL